MTTGCAEETSVSKIKVEENGRSVVVLNSGGEKFKKIRVDGCLVVNETASDWVIAKPGSGDVVIELKGCDVDRAVEQIDATMQYLERNNMRNGVMGGLIVCSRYPKIDSKIQLARQRIAKKFKSPLHIVTRNHEYSFDVLVSFKGPF